MPDGELTVQNVYDSLTAPQKDYLHFLVGYALKHGRESAFREARRSDTFDDFDDIQRRVSLYIVDLATKDKWRKRG